MGRRRLTKLFKRSSMNCFLFWLCWSWPDFCAFLIHWADHCRHKLKFTAGPPENSVYTSANQEMICQGWILPMKIRKILPANTQNLHTNFTACRFRVAVDKFRGFSPAKFNPDKSFPASKVSTKNLVTKYSLKMPDINGWSLLLPSTRLDQPTKESPTQDWHSRTNNEMHLHLPASYFSTKCINVCKWPAFLVLFGLLLASPQRRRGIPLLEMEVSGTFCYTHSSQVYINPSIDTSISTIILLWLRPPFSRVRYPHLSHPSPHPIPQIHPLNRSESQLNVEWQYSHVSLVAMISNGNRNEYRFRNKWIMRTIT